MRARPRRRLLPAPTMMLGGTGFAAGLAHHRAVMRRNQRAESTPSSPGGEDVVAELTKLAQLRDSGALSQDEFDAFKKKLLAT